MLSKRIQIAALGLLAFTAFTMVGCKSTQAPAASEQSALKCDTCKTVWVSKPQQQGKFTSITTSKSMQCPECKSAVATYFATGKLEHSCSACGGQLEKCDVHN